MLVELFTFEALNIPANTLCRLDIVDIPDPVQNNIKSINEHHGFEDKDILNSLSITFLQRQQKSDKDWIKIAQTNKDYSIQNFHGANMKYSVIYRNRENVISKQLESKIVECYHNTLCYSEEIRTKLITSQHFYWKTLCKTVHEICTKCKTCQFLKRNKK